MGGGGGLGYGGQDGDTSADVVVSRRELWTATASNPVLVRDIETSVSQQF